MAGSDLNVVAIAGRLTRDVELKYTSGGMAVASISIATNRSVKKNDEWVTEASFFDVSLFGKRAEALKPYLLKGKQIAVDGTLQQQRWESEGQKHSKVVIIANNVQLMGGGSSEGGNQSQTASQENGFRETDNMPAPEMDQGFPEDIPF